MRYATAIVFKEGISKKQIEEELGWLDSIIDREREIRATMLSKQVEGYQSGAVVDVRDGTPIWGRVFHIGGEREVKKAKRNGSVSRQQVKKAIKRIRRKK